MKVPVRNIYGAEVSEIELSDDIFAVPVNTAVMHQALVRQQANARLGTAKTQSRSEVNRTTAKIYRQKGTGHARHGSRSANIFRGGAVPHGPRPRSYAQAMPRQMRRLALKSALSVKVAAQQLIVLDELRVSTPKTKEMAGILSNLNVDASALVLLAQADETLQRSAHNLADVKTLRAQYLNVADVLGYEYLIAPVAAIRAIEETLQ